MDMTAQTTMATVQAPVNANKGTAAANKVTTPVVQGNGKANQSFTDVLSQTLNGESTTQPSDEASGLEALLQTLSPALLMALLTQGQADKGWN